ncbi:peptidyl-prolyl cis-trans isomerase FKBP17-1, chloroplastic isoform X2 [Hordeum vulgare subsp. vulgare]|uniref:peptidylprolyl isomerase n=1 Tax=Hordeum vulgare subsp. vulgare TaxID=112509 RepID=F2CYX8_HORVV|nr:peptidyl-prolyl cis-trans isomerase FKBP17-1, chloroplastic isoform X2 [Hordeum vulgare subsp. vulgare]BAJ88049.1 predicted protein [Hordeum vulgare subsp. vulgare]
MVMTSASTAAGAVPPPPAKAKPGTLATAPPLTATRRHLLLASAASALPTASASAAASRFTEIPSSGGVKALELREGSGEVPVDGDQVAIHYYGRLAAKQGWRFDSTYDHKDATGDPIPFVFTIGSGNFFDRQRLFTTIFNPTRLANGEGSTLGTVIFDIELISIRQHT